MKVLYTSCTITSNVCYSCGNDKNFYRIFTIFGVVWKEELRDLLRFNYPLGVIMINELIMIKSKAMFDSNKI